MPCPHSLWDSAQLRVRRAYSFLQVTEEGNCQYLPSPPQAWEGSGPTSGEPRSLRVCWLVFHCGLLRKFFLINVYNQSELQTHPPVPWRINPTILNNFPMFKGKVFIIFKSYSLTTIWGDKKKKSEDAVLAFRLTTIQKMFLKQLLCSRPKGRPWFSGYNGAQWID